MTATTNAFVLGQDRTQATETNWLPLLALLVLVIPLRGWLMWNTEVLARDSVVYINYAMEIERLSWTDALMNNHQHPGYPWTIWAVSVPVRFWLGPADSFTMQLSAQLASNLAAVLLIFPMYFLGKFFFERRVAFWGSLLFQYLPVSGQHLSDGVSEALFLLLTSSAFLCSLWALRRQSPLLFSACGVCCGLAYLTRPEGAEVFVVTMLVLAIGPFVPRWQQSWKLNCRFALALTLASLAVGSLYFGATGTFSRKPSTHVWPFGSTRSTPAEVTEIEHAAQASERRADGQAGRLPLMASIFASRLDQKDPLLTRLRQGLYIYVAETLQIFHYVGFLALLAGLLWRGPRLLAVPEFLVPCLFVVLHSAVVVNLACKEGYLSNRHLLTVAAWGVYFAAAGFCDMPARLGQWWLGRAAWLMRGQRLSRLSLPLLVAFVALCLPRTVQKLHASQAGNHVAGLWLAQHVTKGDFIRDDHNWSLYYAGQIFEQCPEPPPGRAPKCYVVVTRGREPKVKEKQDRDEQELRAAGAEIVYHWPETATAEQARIVIYAVDRLGRSESWWNKP